MIGAVLAGALLLSGCASVQTLGSLSPGDDTKAKQFATHPTKANIYVYRKEYANSGILATTHLYLDGEYINEPTWGNSYYLLQVKPGIHAIKSSTGRLYEEPVIKINAKAGKNYYIWQETKFGLMTPRSFLHKVPAKTGMKAVKECKLQSVVKQ